MTRARWCGKVIVLMESSKSACAFSPASTPNDEPIKKQAQLLPEDLTPPSVAASSGELSCFPSGANTQKKLPFGIFARMRAASSDNPCAICVGLGASGRRHSGSSMSAKSQNARRRLAYSPAAER